MLTAVITASRTVKFTCLITTAHDIKMVALFSAYVNSAPINKDFIQKASSFALKSGISALLYRVLPHFKCEESVIL